MKARAMDDLHRRALDSIRSHGLMRAGDAVVVALSGGPDSVALALVLSELSAGGHLPLRLHLAHLNHGLRGAESDAEEAFCREFARRCDCEITLETAAGLADGNGSPEAAARRARYDFLGRVAGATDARVVATGHHADDVAETVLMRLIRGAGIRGLGALAPCRPLGDAWPDIRLVRPLLSVRRATLREFLDVRGQEFCTDSSNADTGFTRNRVRHELIPALERDFPHFSVESLCALNESALETGQLLRSLVEDLWQDLCADSGDGEVSLTAEAFRAAPPPVRKAAALRALKLACGGHEAPALRAEHLRELAGLAERPVGTALSLPGGVTARREHGIIYIRRWSPAGGIAPRPLDAGDGQAVPEAGLLITAERLPAGAVGPQEATGRASAHEVFVDFERTGLPLWVRSRRPGDRFHPLGAPGSKRLKQFLIEQKVPGHLRDRTPLVTTGEGEIVWVVGHRIGEHFRLEDWSGPVLHLRATRL